MRMSRDEMDRAVNEHFGFEAADDHGEIADGRAFLCDGKSGKVTFRLLHIFEFENGKMTREQAWCDLAAIQRQLGVTQH